MSAIKPFWKRHNHPIAERPPLKERWLNYLGAGQLLVMAYWHFFVVILQTFFSDPWKLLHLHALRDKAFARMWISISPPLTPSDKPQPLEGPFAALPALLAAAKGTCLELGPGSGAFLLHYNPTQITTLYGAEPVPEMHPALRKSADSADFGNKYHILHCGGQPESLIPALVSAKILDSEKAKGHGQGKWEVEEGVFDTIICVRVLCSVPNMEATLSTIYDVLKPGGKVVMVEHVVNKWWKGNGSVVGRGWQLVYKALGWGFFCGDCCMGRDTGEALKKIGDLKGRGKGWESVELEYFSEWSVLPFVRGVFVKKA